MDFPWNDVTQRFWYGGLSTNINRWTCVSFIIQIDPDQSFTSRSKSKKFCFLLCQPNAQFPWVCVGWSKPRIPGNKKEHLEKDMYQVIQSGQMIATSQEFFWPPKGSWERDIPLFHIKSRLVKYDNLARFYLWPFWYGEIMTRTQRLERWPPTRGQKGHIGWITWCGLRLRVLCNKNGVSRKLRCHCFSMKFWLLKMFILSLFIYKIYIIHIYIYLDVFILCIMPWKPFVNRWKGIC